MKPLVLEANQVDHFYAGGPAISAFRGVPPRGERSPEDWVGSSVSRSGTADVGLTRLPGGGTLRDAILADPESFLGPAHVTSFGPDPAFLVKLLDAGQRLPVHCHPPREFARRHLDCPYGKTEAWVVVDTKHAGAKVHLGFRVDVASAELAGWVSAQDSAAILGRMHEVSVQPGDAVLVPAGMPHAVGEGIFLVELQEPSDLSVLLEWEGFDINGPRDGHLGLGFDVALSCVDRSGWGTAALEALRQPANGAERRHGARKLFPAAADCYFRGEWLTVNGQAEMDPGFSILVVVSGSGELQIPQQDRLVLRRGMTVLVPWAAGRTTLRGVIDVVRCRPPVGTAENL